MKPWRPPHGPLSRPIEASKSASSSSFSCGHVPSAHVYAYELQPLQSASIRYASVCYHMASYDVGEPLGVVAVQQSRYRDWYITSARSPRQNSSYPEDLHSTATFRFSPCLCLPRKSEKTLSDLFLLSFLHI